MRSPSLPSRRDAEKGAGPRFSQGQGSTTIPTLMGFGGEVLHWSEGAHAQKGRPRFKVVVDHVSHGS